ncbi:SGNH/GDSL hydrolase family protein [Enterococcus pseudoavium]|uniref:SGNH/GDSL hydrolase family protein n=1 Tax=Enterococcus pseudoavium TaxID=44007 RepID=A0ABU3FEZ5_9ENTE|nr:SGNH/GDSL hydrolase family protein [Enterococcus pseudoavium]MDT2769612.1 SGNH/GDSL hydrolase family protein [Enterococcus pseudoavium]
MELDKFRDVDLVIDHINDSFTSRQFVSQNDNDGRTLTLLVTNGGTVGEIPGLTVNLRWTNQASGLTDLSAFELIDKKTSKFQIKYPKNMLNPGKVIASIQIIQNGQVAHSKQFEITVQQLAGEAKGIIQKAEYGALVKVLSDSNKFRTDIDTLDDVKADKTSLIATNAQVASLNSNKVDRGGVSQVSWGMLDQDAKENISGGKVAVVGIDSVSTENIVAQSVTTEKTNFVDADVNIANPANILNGYRYAISNGIVSQISDSAYKCILIPVASDYWYSMNINTYSTNFSHAVDESMKQVSLLGNLEKDSASIFKTTSTTRFIAITVASTVDLTKLVVMQKRENILNYTTNEFPYNQPKNIKIPGLQVGGSPVEELKNPSYKDVISKKSEILKASEFTIFSGGAITDNTWSGSVQYQGMYTRFFESNFEETMIDIDVTVSGLASVDVMLRYRDSTNASKYITLFEATSSFKTTLSFDASNLEIYNDAKDFAILVRNTGTIEGSFTINNLLVYTDEISRLSFYGDNLKDTLLNLDEELQNIKPSEDVFLKSPNGTKYKLSVSDEGVLSVKSTEYAKINVSGNSLVNGINQGSHGTKNFGMCASDSKHDFNYLVQQAILAKNADATFTQNQISGIEMATNQAEYETYRDSIADSYTSDTDLIILQIGDNTTQYIETFENTFPQFLAWLKGKCPIADIIVVGTWFSKAVGYPVVKQCALDAGLNFVDISALNTAENQGSSGMIITYDDATTVVAKDSWIRHPGDVGMKKIADKIIEIIGI